MIYIPVNQVITLPYYILHQGHLTSTTYNWNYKDLGFGVCTQNKKPARIYWHRNSFDLDEYISHENRACS